MQPLPEASSLVCNQLHTPSATSHTLSQASVRPSITFCLASVSLAHILPGLPLTRHAPETRAFYESSRCPSPSPRLSAQQSAGALHQQVLRERFAEVSSTLTTSHHQLLMRHNCPFKLLHLSTGTPKYCDTGISKRKELPPVNDSELKWGCEKALFSPVPESRRVHP